MFPFAMRRPLRLPRLAPGAPCPTSEPTMFSSIWGPGLGSPGPVYTVGFGDQPVLHYAYPSTGRWTFQKTMWPVAGSYTGPVRIRGHQIDGPRWLGFDGQGGGIFAVNTGCQMGSCPIKVVNSVFVRNHAQIAAGVEVGGCRASERNGNEEWRDVAGRHGSRGGCRG